MFSKNRAAFTLLELAIVITVIAVILGISLSAYKTQLSSVEIKNTEDKLKTVQKALDTYFKTNNRYPCPAAGNVLPGAGTYGVEAVTCTPSACPAGMVCGTNSVRGTVPFATLGLSDQFGSDPWLNRVSYAVDYLFTQTDGNCESGGALTIQDYTSTSVSSTAVYALISHGVDGAGSYNVDSGTLLACNTTYKDGENCDVNDVFRASTIKTNTNVATEYYDDIVIWSGNPNLKTCPAGLRDCRVWLDASDKCTITLDAGGVSEWRSKGALKHRALQPTVAIQPNYITASGSLLNNRPYVQFQVGGDFMYIIDTAGDATISSINDPEYTQVAVFRSSSVNGIMVAVTDPNSFGAGAIDRYVGLNGSTAAHYNYNGGPSETLLSTTNYNDNLPHIIVSSTGSASPHKLWVDGSLAATGTHLFSAFNWKTAMTLGGHSFVGYYVGDLLEVLYFDYVLSNEERKMLETYMAVKWGMNF